MFDSFEDEMDIGHVLETQNINETEFRSTHCQCK